MRSRVSFGTRGAWLAVLLLFCLFVQAVAHAFSTSITFDEGPHLAVGYTTLRTGDFRLQPVHIHPPLANVLAAAPVLLQRDLPDPRSVEGWGIASLSAITDAVVWQYPDPRRLALVSRLPIILMSLVLGALVYRWARDVFGPCAGLLALAFCAFDPNIIAHGSLVTTDMAVVLWGTAALFLTHRHLRVGRSSYLVGAGLALGCALASKVSAISLLPIAGVLWLVGRRGTSWRRRWLNVIVPSALAFLTLWACYGFEVRLLTGLPISLPAATHVDIFRSLQNHYELGHPAFLFGQNGERGWWYYFPVAFVLKTPLLTLGLTFLTVLLGVRAFLRRLHWYSDLGEYSRAALWLVLVRRCGALVLYPLVYVAATPFSSVNIGYRHLLPILPFLFIGISSIANSVAHVARRAWRIAIYAGLVVGLAGIVWAVYGRSGSPDYLAYFNPLAGGPDGGYRFLVDSNLDWGQNLWQLRDWTQAHDVEQIYYAHFSPARPSVYGITADFLPPDPRAVPFALLNPAPGYYAIGATVLQGVYTPDVNTFAWFRTHDPVARLGHALFVYRVPDRPTPKWVAICADPQPALAPEAVRLGLLETQVVSSTRIIRLECEQSRIHPAGGGNGMYVLAAGQEPPLDGELEVRGRRPDGTPQYDVVRTKGPIPAPPKPLSVSFEGPLELLGFEVDPSGWATDRVVDVRTHWVVRGNAMRPLSLMAHLVGPDGIPVAIGDGLGLPIDQWQPGDVIVQHHELAVDAGASPGEYRVQVGAYWLDSMERWPVLDGGNGAADHVVLTMIEIPD